MNWIRCYREYVDEELSDLLYKLGWRIYTEMQYVDEKLVSESLENCALLELSEKIVKYVPDLFQALNYLYKNYPSSYIDLLKWQNRYDYAVVGYKDVADKVELNLKSLGESLLRALKLLCKLILDYDKKDNLQGN